MPTEVQQGPRKGSVFRGALWVTLSRAVVRSLGLVSTVILARLLTPEDFGVVAIAMSVLGTLRAFTELGFNHALIHYQDAEDRDYATAWTLDALRGLLLAVILLAAAYPVSLAVDDPRLVAILAFLALVPLVEGLESPRMMIFEKTMRFDVLFRLMVLTKIVGVVTGITGAVIWESYWALLVSMLVTTALRTVASFILAPGRLWPTLASFRKLLHFSGWLAGAEVLAGLATRLNPMILALFTGASPVGVFHMARELSYSTFNEVASPLRRVLFPALSRHESGSETFLAVYRDAVAGLFMVLAPLTLGFALTAHHVVPLVLGEKWLAVIQPLQWLAATLVLTIVGRVAQSAVMADGRTRMIFWRNLIIAPTGMVLFLAGAALFGLNGGVGALVVQMLLTSVVNTKMGGRVTGISFLGHICLPARSWLALATMGAVIFAIDVLIPLGNGAAGHAGALAAKCVGGGMVYAASSLMIWMLAGRPDGPERTVIEALLSVIPKRMLRRV